ncbi:hypothetical protein RJ640_022304 [Escallonia rubra]|uniref:Reverse transcriptase Ty1/copia-type domain-containing protein n=1 Tax=Escallonia rubra TaxID=112253 RepID=A0AA88UD43_9ASTE|nr:hypothetical protein RJ640_022304 [Escallonia rubra]
MVPVPSTWVISLLLRPSHKPATFSFSHLHTTSTTGSGAMTSEISISSNYSSIPGVSGLPTHGNSESSILPITGHKLNGLNYLQWSQSVFMFISGKGKEDYLTGTIETPSKDDPSYKKWNSENHMVMSWLINTMNLEIGQNFMFYGTAKEIWENVKETYSDNENTLELFEIKGILHNLQQGDVYGENSVTSKDAYQFWHLYNESTDSFPLISHINPENNTESSSQEDKSPPNFHAQNTGKWKNLVYFTKPRDNEVEHPILPEPYQDPNLSTVPAESGDDYEEMNRLKTILTKEFEIKDLGKLKYFLGMEVARSNKGISISQRKYTLDLLKETGMLGCKPVDTPMDPICKLGRKEGSSIVDKWRYQRLVGRLINLSHTRPDIGFSVSVVWSIDSLKSVLLHLSVLLLGRESKGFKTLISALFHAKKRKLLPVLDELSLSLLPLGTEEDDASDNDDNVDDGGG